MRGIIIQLEMILGTYLILIIIFQVRGVDFLAKNLGALDNLEENSIDFYASVKSLYLQERKQIANADEITETFDDSDWEEIETQ